MEGYKGIGAHRGQFIPASQALAYALEQTGLQVKNPSAPDHQEFCRAFVCWFYSGSFYWVGKDESDGERNCNFAP